MQGWKTAGWSAVAGFGTLSFLRIVACEIERTNVRLARQQDIAAKAYARRMREAGASEVPPDDRPVEARRNGRSRDFQSRSQG